MSETPTGSNNNVVPPGSHPMDIVSQAAHDGATDARAAAARTWDATSRFVCRFVYTTCYTISYGVVFPSALLAHSIPRNNAAILGLIEGSRAARTRVDQILSPSLDSSETMPALATA
jgi:hypothetical protein